MDAQHQYLYRVFDTIEDRITVSDPKAMAALLAEIEGYLLFHFASEEHLMRHYKYPGFAVHQGDHEAVGNAFLRFLNDFEQNNLNPAKMRIFLTGWLMEHSRLSDAEYASFIQGKRDSFHPPLKPARP